MAGFHNLKTIENQESLVPDVSPDAFAIAPEFDSTEELRVEIDDTDESRPVRYTSDVRLLLHTKDLASRAGRVWRQNQYRAGRPRWSRGR